MNKNTKKKFVNSVISELKKRDNPVLKKIIKNDENVKKIQKAVRSKLLKRKNVEEVGEFDTEDKGREEELRKTLVELESDPHLQSAKAKLGIKPVAHAPKGDSDEEKEVYKTPKLTRAERIGKAPAIDENTPVKEKIAYIEGKTLSSKKSAKIDENIPGKLLVGGGGAIGEEIREGSKTPGRSTSAPGRSTSVSGRS
jgi:hypothetical protein